MVSLCSATSSMQETQWTVQARSSNQPEPHGGPRSGPCDTLRWSWRNARPLDAGARVAARPLPRVTAPPRTRPPLEEEVMSTHENKALVRRTLEEFYNQGNME